jgi:predicted NBD/HSP70 family sugar kinase
VAKSTNMTMDRPDIRRHNLSLLLRVIAARGKLSRANLSAETGMTRATAGSLVSELIDLGLVTETGSRGTTGPGRPGVMLELDGSNVLTIGIEIHIGYMRILVRDLAGRETLQRKVALSAAAVDEVIDAVAQEINEAVSAAQDAGRTVIGTAIAVPGVVDVADGTVVFAPNLGWENVPLLARLRPLVAPGLELVVDNEANLGTLAEFYEGPFAGAGSMAYIFAETGIGVGVMVNRTLWRGASGGAGELGHMPIVLEGGKPCACGRTGCWETLVGIVALVNAVLPDDAERLLADPAMDREALANVVREAAEADQPEVRARLNEFGRWVGIGVSHILDSLDPEIVMLAGHLSLVGPWILDATRASARDHTMPRIFDRCQIVTSTSGFASSGRGGALLIAQSVFNNPGLVG